MITLKPKNKEALINASLGKIDNTLVFVNCLVLNVFTKEFLTARVYVYDRWISHVEYDLSKPLLPTKNTIDCAGKILTPGFIDVHTHIESSLLTPENFAKMVIPCGTLTVAQDAHEIANVCGISGIDYMLKSSEVLPMRQLATVPSCVPSLPTFENSGATLIAEDYNQLFSYPNVIGLGEIMDYEGVIHNEERIHSIIEVAESFGGYLQGHAPRVSGNRLSAYLNSGAESEHEARDTDEVIEKYRQGMWIDFRDSNTGKNMKQMVDTMQSIGNFDRVSFSSDDRRCNVTLKDGHVDGIIRNAVSCGMPLVEALISASYRAAIELGIKNLGAIAPGYIADILLLDDSETINVVDSFFEGTHVSHMGELIVSIPSAEKTSKMENTVNVANYSIEDFSISILDKDEITLNYMDFESFQTTLTYAKKKKFKVKNNKVTLDGEQDMMFVAVFNRHGKDLKTLTVVEKFGISHGALASTVSHDAHNITVVFDTPENGLIALEQLIKQNGGFCAVDNGNVIAVLSLPIAGLMSKKDAKTVSRELELMVDANRRLGNSYLENPVSRITMLSLLVGPYIRLSDVGLILTEEKRIIPVIAE